MNGCTFRDEISKGLGYQVWTSYGGDAMFKFVSDSDYFISSTFQELNILDLMEVAGFILYITTPLTMILGGHQTWNLQ